MEPLRSHGNELILFHVLDPQEIQPVAQGSRRHDRHGDQRRNRGLAGLPEERVPAEDRRAHCGAEDRAQRAGIDYFLLDTSKPLDAALRDYLPIRQGRA